MFSLVYGSFLSNDTTRFAPTKQRQSAAIVVVRLSIKNATPRAISTRPPIAPGSSAFGRGAAPSCKPAAIQVARMATGGKIGNTAVADAATLSQEIRAKYDTAVVIAPSRNSANFDASGSRCVSIDISNAVAAKATERCQILRGPSRRTKCGSEDSSSATRHSTNQAAPIACLDFIAGGRIDNRQAGTSAGESRPPGKLPAPSLPGSVILDGPLRFY